MRRWSGVATPGETPLHTETVRRIRARTDSLAEVSNGELGQLAAALEQRANAGAKLGDLLEEAYALVGEASRRLLSMRPFDVQIRAAIGLHPQGAANSTARGTVVEMQTGEGKTLSAVAPVFLNALTHKGVHVLTVNDYLARRDASWMGPVYRLLGLTVGCVQEGMNPAERRAAYARDVTYLTAKEAGFDLLRNALCFEPEDQVYGEAIGRPFHFALLDEARIPLVIAGDVGRPERGLSQLAAIARQLERDFHYSTDETNRNIFLTEHGIHRVEEALECGNLADPENVALHAEMRNALHAEALLRRDVDYLVRGGEVELVDELTGRIADNRRLPDGIQPAVEAKEGLRLKKEGTILGSITLQHFLGLYPRLSGMTGTAQTAAIELQELYNLEVAVIPTHEPCIRRDEPDLLFTTRQAKNRALVEEISQVHATGRPILVGTVSVAESERLAEELRQTGVECRVLNARNDEEEAAIVAEAGDLGAVTISTNMAGRGTDIRLGGASEAKRQAVLALGGLYVIGTHRHESQRIDDQLRGRAGRQGDPGSSRFILSLEDDLLVRYGIHKLIPKGLATSNSESAISQPLIHKEVARAQRISEGECFDIRRRLSDYSAMVETQRRLIEDWRQEVLTGTTHLTLLERQAAERWQTLKETVDPNLLHRIERRLTLIAIDRCWSDHLEALQRARDEQHWVQLDGRVPLAEFCRFAGNAFDQLLEHIDEEILQRFHSIQITAKGVDWQAEGLQGPSATWTYLVSDNLFANSLFQTLAVRPTFFLGAIVMWPVLFGWALWQNVRNRRRR